MNLKTRLYLTLFVAAVFAHQPVAADEIIIFDPPGFGANANALAGPLFSSDMDIDEFTGPVVGTATATLGGNTAVHSYTFEPDFSMGPAFFDSSYDLTRSAIEGERASAESLMYFMVDAPVTYDLMGFFSVTDEAGTTIPGNVELEMELLDVTDMGMPPITLFYNWQDSEMTKDESFELGFEDGDTTNFLEGSMTGLLEPGKLYKYRTLVTVNAIDIDGAGPGPATDGTATAMGATTIVFMKPAVIPEPGSFMVVSMVALITSLRRRRG